MTVVIKNARIISNTVFKAVEEKNSTLPSNIKNNQIIETQNENKSVTLDVETLADCKGFNKLFSLFFTDSLKTE